MGSADGGAVGFGVGNDLSGSAAVAPQSDFFSSQVYGGKNLNPFTTGTGTSSTLGGGTGASGDAVAAAKSGGTIHPFGGAGAGNVPPGSVDAGTATGTGPGTTPPPPGTGSDFSFGELFGGKLFGTGGFGGVASSLVSGALWGGIVYGGIKMLGSLFGFEKGLTDSLAAAGGLGVGVGSTAYFLANNQLLGSTLGANAGMFGFLLGAGVAVAVFLLTYKKEKTQVIQYQCLPWQPPLGGSNCEVCNKDPKIPCSEYRCKSLGQGCQIVNQGTDKELCVWVTKGDTQAPKIDPWQEALKPLGLKYIPDKAISPPNTGFKIINEKDNKGCLQAFTKLEFGIKTNEPAQCRIDYDLTDKYDSMLYLFGETNLFGEEHTQKLKVPDPFNQAVVPEIYNDGTYKLYVRCMDANGNGQNSAAVAFSFCVKPGPDTTQPIIEGTSITDGSPVRYNADKVPIEVYVNEPAECKWSRADKAYKDMENVMSCATETFQINADLNFVCKTELTGIKNELDNKFFFRCNDLPNKPESERNVMASSFPLTLKGTQPLTIDSVSPNGTIKGGQSVVEADLKVKTSHGANDGKAVCYYSTERDNSGSFIAMDQTNDYVHNQSQFLQQGNYQYFFRCVDAGGNLAAANTTFSISVDIVEPKIARVYKDGNAIKIVTNEEAQCVYSTTNCNYNFQDGIALTYESSEGGLTKNVHYTDWNPAVTYYIKCQDLNGRKPAPNKCSVITQGSEL